MGRGISNRYYATLACPSKLNLPGWQLSPVFHPRTRFAHEAMVTKYECWAIRDNVGQLIRARRSKNRRHVRRLSLPGKAAGWSG